MARHTAFKSNSCWSTLRLATSFSAVSSWLVWSFTDLTERSFSTAACVSHVVMHLDGQRAAPHRTANAWMARLHMLIGTFCVVVTLCGGKSCSA